MRQLCFAMFVGLLVSACAADPTKSPSHAPVVAMPEQPLKSSTQGQAMTQLAKLKINGTESDKDVPGGISLLRHAAEIGEPQAYYNLGLIHYRGVLVPQNYAEAYRFFRTAWEGGVAEAAYYIGAMHQLGRFISQDIVQANYWYELAARRDDQDAQLRLAHNLIRGDVRVRNIAVGLEWLRRAADSKLPEAIGLLGALQASGIGMPQDSVRGFALVQEAADLGSEIAISNLGVMYRDGQGVPRDDIKAVEMFRRAAALGDSSAKYNLAWMYEHGRGVPRDPAEAARLYAEAAAKPSN